MSEGEAVRLQKALARLGVASRRASERLIAEGRVTVNGAVVRELGTRVGPGDRLAVDGVLLEAAGAGLTVLLNKPAGVVCTRRDERGRRTIYDLLPPELPFLAHVGRLDLQTEGVLLLTTDGDLARALLQPASAVPRVYEAKVRGRVAPATLARLAAGVPLDGRPTRPVEVEVLPSRSKHQWLRLTLVEGRNRHVRRILEAVGHPVTRLRRVAFAGLTAGDLPLGGWRPLSAAEIAALRRLAGPQPPSRPSPRDH